MNKKLFIILLFFLLLILVPFFYQTSFSKYTFDYSLNAAKILIDKKPEIHVLSVSNTNEGYETYANKTHQITLAIKIIEKNIMINHFNRDYIQILVGEQSVSPIIDIQQISKHDDELLYSLSISNLTGNGKLSITFPEGIIQDNRGQKNSFLKFNTNIIIDNISPQTSGEEISVENNQSQYLIHSNEPIRPIDDWEMPSTTSLSKVFSSPIYYPIPIIDYAGNITQTFIDIKKARNIMLYYANYNGYTISKFDSNGEISGKQAIIDATNYKSEMLVTYLDGNIDKNALQVRAFDYTYWGENTTALCDYSEIKYQYGYSPSASSWYDMSSNNVVRFLGKLSLQLGGQGHNATGNSCMGIHKPIPQEIASQNLYGLSGIAFKLKDFDTYSIIYQIYVPNVGWLKAASDGEETTYSHDKPFSAIRINIVPSSEKQYILKYWNTFIGTHSIH